MKGLAIITGLLAVLVVLAGSAQATADKGDRKLVVAVEDIGFEPPTAACESGIITFSLVPRDGRPNGSGVSCIHLIDGCSFAARCHDTAHVDFTLTFAQGSLTAPVEIDEIWKTDTVVKQHAKGTITSGTGAFAGASGSIQCHGTLEFTDTAVLPDLRCTVQAK